MKLIDLTCTKCGAQLKVNADLKKCMCQYCGNEMLIDDEVIHHQIDNGIQLGYEQELGRQKFKEQLESIDTQIEQLKNNIKNTEAQNGYLSIAIVISIAVILFCDLIKL